MSDMPNSATEPSAEKPMRLRDALRLARIEAADRTGVVVDLRDAEVARLEILNEALDPLFDQISRAGRPVRFAASARAKTRGCGSTWWRMSRWAATSASTALCRTPASAAS